MLGTSGRRKIQHGRFVPLDGTFRPRLPTEPSLPVHLHNWTGTTAHPSFIPAGRGLRIARHRTHSKRRRTWNRFHDSHAANSSGARLPIGHRAPGGALAAGARSAVANGKPP